MLKTSLLLLYVEGNTFNYNFSSIEYTIERKGKKFCAERLVLIKFLKKF